MTTPFPVGKDALIVVFDANVEMACFQVLGWHTPQNLLDLHVEFRCMTNGDNLPIGHGLEGALLSFNLDPLSGLAKENGKNAALQGGSWTAEARNRVMDGSECIVAALSRLLPAMASGIDLPRALLRGGYVIAAARMETIGVPIDTDTLSQLKASWGEIRMDLISRIDRDYGVFDGIRFNPEKFSHYLSTTGISWPCHTNGKLNLDDDTFKEMARHYPQVQLLREIRTTFERPRLSSLIVGDDGRNRVPLSIFSSKTGRNQPSTSACIFGPSTWMRGLIRPEPGRGLVYIDWSQQEHGIAAALSGDQRMMDAYQSGDPYLAFAKQAGVVPQDANKQTHKAERDQFKATTLAINNGMGAESLAIRLGRPVADARNMIELHKKIYRKFWEWSDAVLNHALLTKKIQTVFGWTLFVSDQVNVRSLRNFPMQANGAEMLRLACMRLINEGVNVCAPIHDAVLVEAPINALKDVAMHAQEVMRWASQQVLGGFELVSDATLIESPSRYMDDRGVVMWNLAMEAAGLPERKVIQ